MGPTAFGSSWDPKFPGRWRWSRLLGYEMHHRQGYEMHRRQGARHGAGGNGLSCGLSCGLNPYALALNVMDQLNMETRQHGTLAWQFTVPKPG